MRYYENVGELIGNTPLIRLRKVMPDGQNRSCLRKSRASILGGGRGSLACSPLS
jgi:hypothetical protein